MARYTRVVSRVSRRRTILAIVASDSTFARVTWQERDAWEGRCIHCRRRLLIGGDGEPIGAATIENIVPRGQGGSDELDNLALACARESHQKGYRLDDRQPDDPVLVRVVETCAGAGGPAGAIPTERFG